MGEEEGKLAVQKHIALGCGYVGVCAGAYLACKDESIEALSSFSRTWDLLPTCQIKDRNEKNYIWKRGMGNAKMTLNTLGMSILEYNQQSIEMFYRNGPCLEISNCVCMKDQHCDSDCHIMSTYDCDFDNNNKLCTPGMVRGSASIVTGRYGKGRVCIFSPHPELSDIATVTPMFKQSFRYVCLEHYNTDGGN